MKSIKTISLLLFISLTYPALAQQDTFIPVDTIQLNQFDSIVQSEWADLTSDGYLDIILLMKGDEEYVPLIFTTKNDSINSMDTLEFSEPVGQNFIIADIDNNNLQDYIYTYKQGKTHLAVNYQQTGIFENSGHLDSVDAIHKFEVFDFNIDGKKDILYYGVDNSQGFLRILENTGNNGWKSIKLALEGEVQNLIVYDANNDGLADIFLTGHIGSDSSYSQLLYYTDDSFIPSTETLPAFSSASFGYGDLNADGSFDLVITGIDSTGQSKTIIRLSEDNYYPLTYLDGQNFENVFLGDINSDGFTDISLQGPNQNKLLLSDSILQFQITDLPYDPGVKNIQKFADYDWDGDLDMVSFSDSLDLFLIRNETPEINEGPSIAKNAVAFSLKNEVKIFWEGSIDDHTPKNSITYDVFIGSSPNMAEVASPNFYINYWGYRTLVSHGNSGFKEEKTVKNIPQGQYCFGVQSVDNAYFMLIPSGNGGGPSEYPCSGLSIACGSFMVCGEQSTEYLTMCGDEPLQIPGGEGAAWYSSRHGFLGFADTLEYIFNQPDTLYSTKKNSESCSDNITWIIGNYHVDLPNEIYHCKEENVKISVPFGYDSLRFSPQVNYEIEQDTIISVSGYTNGFLTLTIFKNQCSFKDSILLVSSFPNLQLQGREYKLIKGHSVSLKASGGDSYLWTPSSGLNYDNISNPVASPLSTTRYTVHAFDSLGCIAIDSVLIIVDDEAFIPNLFTPNNDGQNDLLLIYGLSSARNFVFQIFNRSGNKVYETTDIVEATTAGWNGKSNGQQQPNGIYYWKVSGILDSGKKLLLGGKDSGAIHLMR